jgi:hypothetical protein
LWSFSKVRRKMMVRPSSPVSEYSKYLSMLFCNDLTSFLMIRLLFF